MGEGSKAMLAKPI
jgi:hypothetical protein